MKWIGHQGRVFGDGEGGKPGDGEGKEGEIVKSYFLPEVVIRESGSTIHHF